MNVNRWIASSQRVYRWLLHLYPRAYRAAYETEMFHLFTDQCREVYQSQGRLGGLVLWLRTLADLAVTLIREHLSDPRASAGLLEAVPNQPLPWKGVLLVLIPGLIFFISQVEQVTSNNNWFFVAYHRAGYFLILPVLLVWLLTRRFPVWGFIPLGLLYATLWNYGQILPLERLPIIGGWFTSESMELFGIQISTYTWRYLFTSILCLVLLGVLIWSGVQHGHISRGVWKWLGIYGLLFVLRILAEGYRSSGWWVFQEDARRYIVETALGYGYDSLPFLLLVFIGMLFARKYEGFSFLLLLGFLLPTVIFGRYHNDWNDHLPFSVVRLAVLIYRFVIALVAPVWLVRAASVPGRQRAAAIPVAIAILCHLSLNLFAWRFAELTRLDLMLNIWGYLMTVVSLGLAIVLYLPREKNQTVDASLSLAETAE